MHDVEWVRRRMARLMAAPCLATGVRGVLRIGLLGGLALGISSCGPRSVPEPLLGDMQSHFNELMLRREPLCIEAGPFPYRSDEAKVRCNRCQDLEQAGLLVRHIVDDSTGNFVEYVLSEEGASVYRLELDPEHRQRLLADIAKRGQPMSKLTWKMLDRPRPRMCFGKTRFHSVADALAPLQLGSSTYVSVKLVAEAIDTSGRLFDPRIMKLGLPTPAIPEPGKPALYPAQVTTFQVLPNGSLDINDLRYGAWVDKG